MCPCSASGAIGVSRSPGIARCMSSSSELLSKCVLVFLTAPLWCLRSRSRSFPRVRVRPGLVLVPASARMAVVVLYVCPIFFTAFVSACSFVNCGLSFSKLVMMRSTWSHSCIPESVMWSSSRPAPLLSMQFLKSMGMFSILRLVSGNFLQYFRNVVYSSWMPCSRPRGSRVSCLIRRIMTPESTSS